MSTLSQRALTLASRQKPGCASTLLRVLAELPGSAATRILQELTPCLDPPEEPGMSVADALGSATRRWSRIWF